MLPIEKRHYHDEVFRECAKTIRRLFISNFLVDELIEVLEIAADFVDGFEKRLLVAVNNKNGDEAISITRGFIRELFDTFFNSGNALRMMFLHTFNSVCMAALDYECVESDSEEYNFLMDYFRRDYRRKPLRFSNCLAVFYGVIKAIVVDVNKREKAWRIVGEYYRNDNNIDIENDEVYFQNRRGNEPVVTFLSYAFVDRAYAFFLFLYFLNNNGFLFVDFLFNPKLSNGVLIKRALYPWIAKSSQFLFLRSVHSDNHQIRQWCSWEMGRSFDNHHSFFIADVIGVKNNSNRLLDDFEQFDHVTDGIIYA